MSRSDIQRNDERAIFLQRTARGWFGYTQRSIQGDDPTHVLVRRQRTTAARYKKARDFYQAIMSERRDAQ